MPRKKATKGTSTRKRSVPDWAPKFLARLGLAGNIREAAQVVKVNRRTVYKRRDADPDFAAAMEDALADAMDRLRKVAWTRASKKSDKLLMYLLSRHDTPAPLQVDVTSKGESLADRDSLTAADIAAAAALVAAAGLGLPANGGAQPVDPAHAPPTATPAAPPG